MSRADYDELLVDWDTHGVSADTMCNMPNYNYSNNSIQKPGNSFFGSEVSQSPLPLEYTLESIQLERFLSHSKHV